VPVTLEPRESINNMGMLSITLADGQGIRGVDRGGKSDPFAVFSLNGQKVYKSQTKKKTLNPVWNEPFDVSVSSRVGSNFEIEVFDWNQIEQAKLLGAAKIDLEDIDPFKVTEKVVTLLHTKHGDVGAVRVNLLFRPEIIMRARKNTSTFSTAGRAMTHVGAAPINIGKGVFHGVTGVFKRVGTHSADSDEEATGGAAAAAAAPVNGDLHGTQMSQPVGAGDRMGASGAVAAGTAANGNVPPLPPVPSEPGTLRVTVMDAKDLSAGSESIRPYVVVRVGDREHKTKHAGKTVAPEWNESFEFVCGTGTPKLFAQVFNHHTLGKDKPLGEAEVDIWKHIQPVGEAAADVFVEMREGTGILKFRLAFDPTPQQQLHSQLPASSSRKSISSEHKSVFSSPSRFSTSGRGGRKKSDDESR